MSRLRPRVACVEPSIDLVELAVEFAPSIRQHWSQLPALLLHLHSCYITQEGCSFCCVAHRNERRHRVRTGGIARRQLPQFPDALEVADAGRIDTHELYRLLCL